MKSPQNKQPEVIEYADMFAVQVPIGRIIVATKREALALAARITCPSVENQSPLDSAS